MPTYAELQQQITALQQQAQAARRAEVASVIAEIRARMAEYDISIADLGGRVSRSKGSTVAAKYRHPHTGETWTGRGKMPRWLQAEVNSGKKKDDFLIA